jgi:hypothetical protein
MKDYDYHKAWIKYICDPGNCPPLPQGFRRSTLIAYCLVLAEYGTYGKDCHPSNATVGRALGIPRAQTICGYRQIALQLGWFQPNGKRSRGICHVDVRKP